MFIPNDPPETVGRLCAGDHYERFAMNRRDHGDGGIDARGPDRWRLRWRVDGRRFSKSFHGSISEARKELRRLIKNADDGQHVAPDKLTLAGWADRWIALLRRGDDTGKKRRG